MDLLDGRSIPLGSAKKSFNDYRNEKIEKYLAANHLEQDEVEVCRYRVTTGKCLTTISLDHFKRLTITTLELV